MSLEAGMDLAAVIATTAAAASAIFAALGLIFAGRQLQIASEERKQAREERQEDRRVAYDGVTVSWQALEAPARSETDGYAQWLYEFAVQNPGRLPIQNVLAQVTFPCDVIRIRYDGSRGRPVRTLTMRHPVLAGGERRMWRRRLRIAFSARASLKETVAQVEFQDVDGAPHENVWPKHSGLGIPSTEADQDNFGTPQSAPAPQAVTPAPTAVAPIPPIPAEPSEEHDAGRPSTTPYSYGTTEETSANPFSDFRGLGE